MKVTQHVPLFAEWFLLLTPDEVLRVWEISKDPAVIARLLLMRRYAHATGHARRVFGPIRPAWHTREARRLAFVRWLAGSGRIAA